MTFRVDTDSHVLGIGANSTSGNLKIIFYGSIEIKCCDEKILHLIFLPFNFKFIVFISIFFTYHYFIIVNLGTSILFESFLFSILVPISVFLYCFLFDAGISINCLHTSNIHNEKMEFRLWIIFMYVSSLANLFWYTDTDLAHLWLWPLWIVVGILVADLLINEPHNFQFTFLFLPKFHKIKICVDKCMQLIPW